MKRDLSRIVRHIYAAFRRHSHKAMTVTACLVVFVMVYSLILPALTIDQTAAASEPGMSVSGAPESVKKTAANGQLTAETVAVDETDAGQSADEATAAGDAAKAEAGANVAETSAAAEAAGAQAGNQTAGNLQADSQNGNAANEKGAGESVAADSSAALQNAAGGAAGNAVGSNVGSNSSAQQAGGADVSRGSASDSGTQRMADAQNGSGTESESGLVVEMSAAEFEQVILEPAEDPEQDPIQTYRVTASAKEGTFPAGTTMELRKLTAEEYDQKLEETLNQTLYKELHNLAVSYEGIDITFRGIDGNEIEPKQPLAVRISTGLVRLIEEPKLVHISLDAQTKQITGGELLRDVKLENEFEDDLTTGEENTLTFQIDQFSPFIIAETEEADEDNLPAYLDAEQNSSENDSDADAIETEIVTDANATEEGDSGAAALEEAAAAEDTESAASEGAQDETDAESESDWYYSEQDETQTLTAEENGATITVTYGADAGIPEGAELHVAEILPGDADYQEYYQQALAQTGSALSKSDANNSLATVVTNAVADLIEEIIPDELKEISASETIRDERAEAETSNDAAGNQSTSQSAHVDNQEDYARIFDIEIRADGEKIEPAAEVSVNIQLPDAPETEDADLQVVHFGEDGPEMMETEMSEEAAEGETEIRFDTDAFSVYAVVYTVDFSFNINGKEYAFSLEGGDSISFKEIIRKFEIFEEEEADIFINNIAKVEFSNPEYLWNGKIEESAFAGDLKEKYQLEIQYATNIRWGNVLAMNAHHYAAPDWVLIALKPFASEEMLTVTMKDGEVFTVKVTDAQDYIVYKTDGTVQTIANPAGTTIDLFNYYVSSSTRDTAGRDQWPGHVYGEEYKFNWYNDDGGDETSWDDGWKKSDEWQSKHLFGCGNNLGINKDHALKFSPAMGGTVRNGTLDAKTKDGEYKINSWTGHDNVRNGTPTQGIYAGALSGGYPVLSGNSDIGANTESLQYLFDPEYQHEGKDSYSGANNLFYVDDDGYYVYQSADYNASFNKTTKQFSLTEQAEGSERPARGFWPFGQEVYWVGLHMKTQFLMPAGGQVLNPAGEYKPMTFEFAGDDDALVYLDGILVGDGGGIHNITKITINFQTGDVQVIDTEHNNSVVTSTTIKAIFEAAHNDGRISDEKWQTYSWNNNTFADGSYHTFDFFYMERGGGESNLYIKYNMVSTYDFTGHKSYTDNPEGVLHRDQFQFELIGLDGKYDTDGNLVDAEQRAIMPTPLVTDASAAGGTVANPTCVYDSSNKQTIYTTGVSEDGNINFGQANISSDEMNAADQNKPSVYHYIIREVIPDEAVNSNGIRYADASDDVKAQGGFVYNETQYDNKIYYMTAQVNRWQDDDGNYHYGLSKKYFEDSSYTTPAKDQFVSFTNSFVPTYGNVNFTKRNGSGQVLDGATFTLYKDKACTTIVKNLNDENAVATSGSDGKVSFSDVPVGIYYMKETSAPANYMLDGTLYKVTIEDARNTSVSSKIIVDGDETETTVTEIINTKPGEISVVKKWVDSSGRAVDVGNNSATVQLRRYKQEGTRGHSIDVKIYYDTSLLLDSGNATVEDGGSVDISWYDYSRGNVTVYVNNKEVKCTSSWPRSSIKLSNVKADQTVRINYLYNDTSNDSTKIEKINPSNEGGKGEYIIDSAFPASGDLKATQTLSSPNWIYTWKIGDGNDYDFPATDGKNLYLYYVVEIKDDGTVIPINGEVEDGITLRSITYSPAKTEDKGIQQGVITVKNEVTAPAETEIVIRKYKKDDLENSSAETLKGATFRLEKYKSSDYQEKDDQWQEQTLSDTGQTGIFNFTNLHEGFYKIVEVVTPPGYVKVSIDPTFEVRSISGQLEVIFTDTDLVKYTSEGGFRFGNEPGAKLPNAGGPGTRLYTFSGLALILSAALMYGFRMRRRERRLR